MLRNQEIEQVKVQWKHFGLDDAIWEMVDWMLALYPSLCVGQADEFWHMYVYMCMVVDTTMSCVIKLQ